VVLWWANYPSDTLLIVCSPFFRVISEYIFKSKAITNLTSSTGYGRTRLYGVELVIVVFSTIALAASSNGVGNSMKVLGWLVSMRFLMGVGIGAEYPLSATICTEYVYLVAPLSPPASIVEAFKMVKISNSRLR
jgi:MFS family permease